MGLFDVIVLGFAVLLLVLAARGWNRSAPAGPGAVQEFAVHLDERGFRPNVLLVRPGIPVRIRFYAGRDASTVVIPHWGIRRRVSALRRVTVDLVATGSGRYRFFGAEDANEGRIVVMATPRSALAQAPAQN